MAQISIDTRAIDRMASGLKGLEKEVAQAARLALNRTIDFTMTQVTKEVRKAYTIKASEVKDSFKGGIKRPTNTSLEATITSRGERLSLAHFPFTPKRPNRKAKSVFARAVVVQIRKDKVMSRKGFVATTGARSADKVQYNVFKRSGKLRLPIEPIRTLSIPQMITNVKVGEQISKAATEKLAERLDHEITRILTSKSQRYRR